MTAEVQGWAKRVRRTAAEMRDDPNHPEWAALEADLQRIPVDDPAHDDVDTSPVGAVECLDCDGRGMLGGRDCGTCGATGIDPDGTAP